jgi:hypothetical protein
LIEGSDSYSFYLTNEHVNVPADENGNTDSTFTSNTIAK